MALFLFTKAMLAGESIKVLNHGRHKRRFTYIVDIVEEVVRAWDRVPRRNGADSNDPDPATSGEGSNRLYNIGSRDGVELLRYIRCSGSASDARPKLQLPLQAGYMRETEAACDDLVRGMSATSLGLVWSGAWRSRAVVPKSSKAGHQKHAVRSAVALFRQAPRISNQSISELQICVAPRSIATTNFR